MEVDGDPEADDWEEKLGEAWAVVPAAEISEAASMIEHVLVEPPEGEFCESCDAYPESTATGHLPGCPDDGKAMCYQHHACNPEE